MVFWMWGVNNLWYNILNTPPPYLKFNFMFSMKLLGCFNLGENVILYHGRQREARDSVVCGMGG